MQMSTAKKNVNFFLWFVVEGKKKNNGEKYSPDLSSMNIFARFLNAVAGKTFGSGCLQKEYKTFDLSLL